MLRIIATILALYCSVVAKGERVSLAQFNMEYPPLQQFIKGSLDGPDLQLCIEAFRRMPSYELDVKQMSISRALHEFRMGRLVLFFNYGNAEFKSYSLYPSHPLRWAVYRMVTMKGNTLSYQTVEDLKGVRIALINVTPLSKELEEAKKKGLIEVERVSSHKQVLEMLKRGRVDAIFMHVDVALYYAKQLGIDVEVQNPGPYSKRGLYTSISLRAKVKDHKLLQRELSAALESMYLDGTHQAIMSQYGANSFMD